MTEVLLTLTEVFLTLTEVLLTLTEVFLTPTGFSYPDRFFPAFSSAVRQIPR